MNFESKDRVERLVRKGVTIPDPLNVLIADEVQLDRIAGDGVVIYPGCKIFGNKTLIMPGAILGYEGPVTVEDCQIGPNVELKGGFFRRSAFLEKASMGFGAQVRDGCILEEEANGAHTVGFKQTILFPFVTVGSLINFCDCLMAGGTSRKNHSEVGSSYIHFNYTPNQDKATPSLIGDVPRGVMQNQLPIFLGGQGGLVGPVRVEYGTVIAAGLVYRKDVLEGGRLILSQGQLVREGLDHDFVMSFYSGLYFQIKSQTLNNINYIANIIALRQWYQWVRSQFFGGDPMGQMFYEGVLDKLNMAIKERIERLKAFVQKMPESSELYRKVMKKSVDDKLLRQKQELYERWPDVEAALSKSGERAGDSSSREPFLEQIDKLIKENGRDYIAVIQGLEKSWSAKGTKWLQGILDEVNQQVLELLPSFKEGR